MGSEGQHLVVLRAELGARPLTRAFEGGGSPEARDSLSKIGFLSAPGPLELIVILVVALIFLGPSRLPGAARSVGKGMREFRESLAGIGDDPEDDPYDELDVSDEDEVEDVDPGADSRSSMT